jgi:hypothetical protein
LHAVAQDYVKGLLSSGEVVLVDTRQHWMAAIRFALKPILLIIGVILLALINSWLQFGEALSFINDIVAWILIIAAIIAVIWLPIDLIRWYSRHYVLTNRRAMRMEGVFRKKSFDSSLEQINDIAFSQSVFGRALGYADLTLYTASDTANESYDQLMDGAQFKKAVLDAKEGIRMGQPLTSLAPGFIIKGGTNEASMRADGKIQEAAAGAATDADAGADQADAPTDAGAPMAPPPADADMPNPLDRVADYGTTEPTQPAAAPPPPPAAPAPEPEAPAAPEPLAEPAVVVEPESDGQASASVDSDGGAGEAAEADAGKSEVDEPEREADEPEREVDKPA